LSTFVFWLKFYWRFSTLKKQIYPFFFNLNTILKCWFLLHIFVVYVFCLGVYLFYFFSQTNLLYGFMICTCYGLF
jgi:hypothetical protein